MKVLPCSPSPISSIAEIPLDRAWDEAHATFLAMADGADPPSHLQTSVQCFWTEESLLALFRGRFAVLRTIQDAADRSGKTPRLWERSDVAELFIGVETNVLQHYCEFQVAPDGRWNILRVQLKDGVAISKEAWEPEFQCRTLIDHQIREWRIAMMIPWRAMRMNGMRTDVWRCNFYRASGRFHGDELLAWAPTGYGDHCFHKPHVFGRLQLIS